MIRTPFLARHERFDVVGSTNDVVRDWLEEGTPEVCLAVADEQTAGRGREGRTWTASAGRGLLLSLGFRPTWLQPDRAWRLAAATSLAMADAAEQVAGLASGTIRLKWPNDLVVESSGEWLAGASPSSSEGSKANRRSDVRKLAGVLGETVGLGTDDPRAVVGIGVNTDWPATAFPADIAATMTSLREAAAGRPIDNVLLLDTFTARVEARIGALRAGRFGIGDWVERQLTDGRLVRVEHHDGRSETVRAVRADPVGGGLVIKDPAADGGERTIVSGEIRHLRLPEAV
jgi:BirA family transcriptional regulator, biotin operon repressor / biotin---[acetyl-CoA-carboxylase] ligase